MYYNIMSYQFYLYYNSINKPFTILKENKSKTKFTLKQNNYKFKVDLEKIQCTMCPDKMNCQVKKCFHIYELFSKYFQISNELLPFLWVNDNHLNAINNQPLDIQDKDLECPICLESTDIIKTPNKKIIHCLECNKYYHRKCINKTKKSECPNCLSQIII
tara:strand:+ start:349 stop:828 length:480 start_codon:yes stop_codon:yes gene_type:complete